MRRALRRTGVVASALCLLPFAAAAEGDADTAGLRVHDAWVRLPPPATNAAAYLRLENAGDGARTLVGARSPDCERIEVHRSIVADGRARMEPAGPLELAPGDELVFAPRGLHLMLIAPRALAEGERVSLVLELEDGGTLPVAAEVRRRAPSGDAAHEHHRH